MRALPSLLMTLLLASPAFAQQYYAEQSYPNPPAQAPQQVSGIYQGDAYVPSTAPVAPRPAPAASQQVPASQPRPGEYGESVMTDIRQMNF